MHKVNDKVKMIQLLVSAEQVEELARLVGSEIASIERSVKQIQYWSPKVSRRHDGLVDLQIHLDSRVKV